MDIFLFYFFRTLEAEPRAEGHLHLAGQPDARVLRVRAAVRRPAPLRRLWLPAEARLHWPAHRHAVCLRPLQRG